MTKLSPLILLITILSNCCISKKPDYTLKSKQPREAIDEFTKYLVDIHFFSGDINAQYIAYHFCTLPKDGLSQCALFDGPSKDARFIGTEFMITRDIFESLPEDEKPLWHSHVYEVKSGLLAAPGLSAEDDLKEMEWLIGTFGKVVDVWHQGYDLPITPPMVAHALSLDSQVDWDLADHMDKLLNLPTTYKERRELRKHLTIPSKSPGADSYLKTGVSAQYAVVFLEMENYGKINRKNLGKYDFSSSDL